MKNFQLYLIGETSEYWTGPNRVLGRTAIASEELKMGFYVFTSTIKLNILTDYNPVLHLINITTM